MWLRKDVSNLIISSNRKDLDDSLSDMFTKMMIDDVDVLGSQVKLWKSGEFECSCIVFKGFAINSWFITANSKAM